MSAKERAKIPSLVPHIVVELLSESQRKPSAVVMERAKCERWFKAVYATPCWSIRLHAGR